MTFKDAAVMPNIEGMIYEQCRGKVFSGPFRGMRLDKQYIWNDGNFTTKLLGSYEFELHSVIEKAMQRKPDTLINVGCAEGYYSVGIGRLRPYMTVFAMDKNNECLDQCSKNAMLNGILKLVTVVGEVGPEDLIKGEGKKLYIVDIEGFELAVLDPTRCADLYTSDIIIECHDFFFCNEDEPPTSIISDELERRFINTHTIERIEPRLPHLDDYPCLNGMTMGNALLAITEKRPHPTCWLACWALERRN